jgi:hypothetical protein
LEDKSVVTVKIYHISANVFSLFLVESPLKLAPFWFDPYLCPYSLKAS